MELSFKNEKKVCNRYRGKTIKFVVNNGSNNPKNYTQYALTPLIDGWDNSDIIILDDYCDFNNMMCNLWPVNRTPFRGWKQKEVDIKIVGKVEKLPLCFNEIEFNNYQKYLSSLKDQSILKHYYIKYNFYTNENITNPKIIDVVSFDTLCVEDVERQHGFDIFVKITTPKDVKLVIEFLKNEIEKISNKIFTLKNEFNQDIVSIKNSLNIQDEAKQLSLSCKS